MSQETPSILIVDDEPFYLEVIANALEGQGYELHYAHDGEEAWNLLRKGSPDCFDVVILDRIMPVMDGMETLQRIKTERAFKTLPVIMQTAASTPEEVADGLAAGAWYYLAKPYRGDALRRIVTAALADGNSHRNLERLSAEMHCILSMVATASFRFRSPGEARQLAKIMAQLSANQDAVSMGLTELMINAVEHGNLGIGYAEKGRLMEDWTLEEEIESRLADPELGSRWAELEYCREAACLQFTIRDQGKGFDWSNYLEMDPARAFDSHGRGIALSRQIAFSAMQYQGCGNAVTVTVEMNENS